MAEVAGVAVGSMYQYFPDKRSLVTALHERHAEAALQVIYEALTRPGKLGLEESVRCVVRGLLQLHRVEPRLQRLLHDEQATLQYRKADSSAGRAIVASTIAWLEAHAEVRHRDLTLTAQVLVRTIEELVHGAVIDPPEAANAEDIEQSIVAMAIGYLLQPA